MILKVRFKRKKTFPVISMADIVLLLLIFFLLTSSFLVQPGIKVHLPRTATKEALSREKVSITITKSGAVYLEDKPVDITRLPFLLEGVKDKVMLIKADRDVTIDMTVKVMDMVRRSGANKFVIATTPEVE
ncbi:MAG: biopolymer transporter ExbD [Candidatus Stahlbacteria bacterium]|nr:biopolymer transporter ExbD [candidate division WOR-3 bacterium]TET99397.1 MAG: biopolymer transporter ExbD [Candidatus Stahlbacteria bacterium]